MNSLSFDRTDWAFDDPASAAARAAAKRSALSNMEPIPPGDVSAAWPTASQLPIAFVCFGRLINQVAPPFVGPGPLVGGCHILKVSRLGIVVVDPLAQQRRAVDDVDRKHVLGIFVGEVLAAPERVFREQLADRLEPQRLQPPGFEVLMVIGVALGM